jgi:hypothetical protein
MNNIAISYCQIAHNGFNEHILRSLGENFDGRTSIDEMNLYLVDLKPSSIRWTFLRSRHAAAQLTKREGT